MQLCRDVAQGSTTTTQDGHQADPKTATHLSCASMPWDTTRNLPHLEQLPRFSPKRPNSADFRRRDSTQQIFAEETQLSSKCPPLADLTSISVNTETVGGCSGRLKKRIRRPRETSPTQNISNSPVVSSSRAQKSCVVCTFVSSNTVRQSSLVRAS